MKTGIFLTTKQLDFIKETMQALINGAIVGKDHYTVSITRIELQDIIKVTTKTTYLERV